MRVLITGANGFIGKNLKQHLSERKNIEIICFNREDELTELPSLVSSCDFIFHLAGVNRSQDLEDFDVVNAQLTTRLGEIVREVCINSGKKIPLVFTSSAQAGNDSKYGQSKLEGERALFALSESLNIPVHIFRLPNVFGKWCKPNYNSAIATFCHNIARAQPIKINDPLASLTVVYIDDVIEQFLKLIDGEAGSFDKEGFALVQPIYKTTVGEVASILQKFNATRTKLEVERVGTGLTRALYSTYLSYLPEEDFSYVIPAHGDKRGVFVEMLKTPDSGQLSYFTAHPGITRGGHYHHSKVEKFLVIKGRASFKFRQIETGATHEVLTDGDTPTVVETIPGWTHDVTNVGNDELIVMLWANEVFNREKPDTYAMAVQLN